MSQKNALMLRQSFKNVLQNDYGIETPSIAVLYKHTNEDKKDIKAYYVNIGVPDNKYGNAQIDFILSRVAYCCGAVLIYKLNVIYSNFPKQEIHNMVDSILRTAIRGRGRSVGIYVSTSAQGRVNEVLDAIGWTLTDAGTNRNTGNKLYTRTKRY